jgi:hypothetical protein
MDIEVDVLIFATNPRKGISAIKHSITRLFREMINGEGPEETDNIEEWCRKDFEKLENFLENLTPEFIDQLNIAFVMNSDNELQMFLNYRTFIAKESNLFSSKELVDVLRRELKEALKDNKRLFNLRFENRR